MINRRTLFGASSAAVSFVAAALASRKAAASNYSFDIEARGTAGRLERLPSLNAESRDDFFNGIRGWRSRALVPAARQRFNAILSANGHDPKKDLPLSQIIELVQDDTLVNTEVRIFCDTKRNAHHNFKREFEGQADAYLAEMEAYDNRGPGTLELNPEMHVPQYTRHEIHQQPGGYVGSPFAGAVYHYGTNAFYMARNILNDQDQNHANLASQMPQPTDGRVRRILDMGCGIGQLSIALKERFSAAEIWGVDVAAPMIRYGHMRAVDLEVDVNFAQRLAEDSKFPDNHFDIVTSYILHHEVTEEASKQIIAEAFRVLRPGGVYFPIDFYTGGRPRATAHRTFMEWVDHRWNNEVWRPDYAALDFPGEMAKVGFDVNEKGPAAWTRHQNLLGVKPA
jgi:SAM-dependent methyltransferase